MSITLGACSCYAPDDVVQLIGYQKYKLKNKITKRNYIKLAVPPGAAREGLRRM